jgi:hypothetical protein
MACPGLRPLLIALALVPGACDGRRGHVDKGSVTVKLPPARPPAPAPAFSYGGRQDSKLGYEERPVGTTGQKVKG